MDSTPHLRVERVRVDEDGAPVIDSLSLATRGRRALVLGAPRALFEAASGLRPIAYGTLALAGRAPAEALQLRAAAVIPCDPPLPARWSVRQYVVWSARLAGLGDATDASADAALARLGLTGAARDRLDRAAPPVRRAVVIAAALATGAPLYLLDDPLVGLADDAAKALGALLVEALGDAGFVAFLPRAPLASPLVAAADEALLVDGSSVLAQGAPNELAASTRAFVLRVDGDTARFAEAA